MGTDSYKLYKLTITFDAVVGLFNVKGGEGVKNAGNCIITKWTPPVDIIQSDSSKGYFSQ